MQIPASNKVIILITFSSQLNSLNYSVPTNCLDLAIVFEANIEVTANTKIWFPLFKWKSWLTADTLGFNQDDPGNVYRSLRIILYVEVFQ